MKQKAGKTIHAWAWEGDADPDRHHQQHDAGRVARGSGTWVEFPEVDRCAWFTAAEAHEKLNPAQAVLVDRLEELLDGQTGE